MLTRCFKRAGRVVYRLTFILVSLVTLVSAALASLLYFRTRWIYQTIYQQIQEHQEETAESPDPQM